MIEHTVNGGCNVIMRNNHHKCLACTRKPTPVWEKHIESMRSHLTSKLKNDICMYTTTDTSIPPPAIVAFMRVSNSSSPLMANCRCLGVILFTFKSFEQLPANSRTCIDKWVHQVEKTFKCLLLNPT